MQLHKMNLVISGSGSGYIKIADSKTDISKDVLLVSFRHEFSQEERNIIIAGIVRAPLAAYTAAMVAFEKKLHEAGTLDRLNEIYAEFLDFNGYPQLSADELLTEPDVDGMNRLWLTEFSAKYEAIANPRSPELSEYLVVGRIHGGPTNALKVKALDATHAKRVFSDTVWAAVQPPIEGAREANEKQYGCDVQIDVIAVGDGIQVVKS